MTPPLKDRQNRNWIKFSAIGFMAVCILFVVLVVAIEFALRTPSISQKIFQHFQPTIEDVSGFEIKISRISLSLLGSTKIKKISVEPRGESGLEKDFTDEENSGAANPLRKFSAEKLEVNFSVMDFLLRENLNIRSAVVDRAVVDLYLAYEKEKKVGEIVWLDMIPFTIDVGEFLIKNSEMSIFMEGPSEKEALIGEAFEQKISLQKLNARLNAEIEPRKSGLRFESNLKFESLLHQAQIFKAETPKKGENSEQIKKEFVADFALEAEAGGLINNLSVEAQELRFSLFDLPGKFVRQLTANLSLQSQNLDLLTSTGDGSSAPFEKKSHENLQAMVAEFSYDQNHEKIRLEFEKLGAQISVPPEKKSNEKSPLRLSVEATPKLAMEFEQREIDFEAAIQSFENDQLLSKIDIVSKLRPREKAPQENVKKSKKGRINLRLTADRLDRILRFFERTSNSKKAKTLDISQALSGKTFDLKIDLQPDQALFSPLTMNLADFLAGEEAKSDSSAKNSLHGNIELSIAGASPEEYSLAPVNFKQIFLRGRFGGQGGFVKATEIPVDSEFIFKAEELLYDFEGTKFDLAELNLVLAAEARISPKGLPRLATGLLKADFLQAREKLPESELANASPIKQESIAFGETKFETRFRTGFDAKGGPSAIALNGIKFHSFGKKLGLTGSLASNLSRNTLRSNLTFSIDNESASMKLGDNLLGGSFDFPAEIYLREGGQLTVLAKPVFNNFSYKNMKSNLALLGVNGRILVEENIRFEKEKMRFSFLLSENPFARVDFSGVRPLMESNDSFRIDQILFEEKKYGPLIADAELKQNLVFFRDFKFKHGTGFTTGSIFVDFWKKAPRLGFLLRSTQLKLAEVVPQSVLKSELATSDPINYRASIVYALNDTDIDGQFDITKIGPGPSISMINFLDPEFEDSKMNMARSLLSKAYPKNLSLFFHNGLLDFKIVTNAGRAEQRGINIYKFIREPVEDIKKMIFDLPIE